MRAYSTSPPGPQFPPRSPRSTGGGSESSERGSETLCGARYFARLFYLLPRLSSPLGPPAQRGAEVNHQRGGARRCAGQGILRAYSTSPPGPQFPPRSPRSTGGGSESSGARRLCASPLGPPAQRGAEVNHQRGGARRCAGQGICALILPHPPAPSSPLGPPAQRGAEVNHQRGGARRCAGQGILRGGGLPGACLQLCASRRLFGVDVCAVNQQYRRKESLQAS